MEFTMSKPLCYAMVCADSDSLKEGTIVSVVEIEREGAIHGFLASGEKVETDCHRSVVETARFSVKQDTPTFPKDTVVASFLPEGENNDLPPEHELLVYSLSGVSGRVRNDNLLWLP